MSSSINDTHLYIFGQNIFIGISSASWNNIKINIKIKIKHQYTQNDIKTIKPFAVIAKL